MNRAPMSRPAPARPALLVMVVVLLLSSCGVIPGREPRRIADHLAEQITTGRWDDPTGPIAEQTEAALAGMDRVRPVVRTGRAEQDGDRATVPLHYAWTFPTGVWSYDTVLHLERRSGTWEPAWNPAVLHPELDTTTTLRHTPQPAERGRVRDTAGEVLAGPMPVTRLGLNRTLVSDAEVADAARAIAAVLDIDADRFTRRAEAAGPEAFVEGLAVRGTGPGAIPPEFAGIKGAAGYPAERILTVDRGFAEELIGRVSDATAEDMERDPMIVLGQQVGQSGLQARYQDRLGGRPGSLVERVDVASGEPVGAPLFATEPIPGDDLTITVDRDLQTRAEGLLDGVDPAASIAAIRPSTGEILVLANSPGSDGAQNANSGRFAPGSTFKIVTALALMRQGLTPDSPLTCPETTVLDGRRFKNYADFPADQVGPTTLRGAIAHSCNTALIDQHDRITGEGLRDAAGSLGLGIDHDLGFPIYFGEIPDPTNTVGVGEAIIGQGRTQVSPVAMAAVAASVADGSTVVPHLLPGQEADAGAAALTPAETAALRDLMGAVVTDGSARSLAPEARGAKTGTAEYGAGDASRGDALATHAWLIAYGDDLAVAAFVHDGASGSGTAGPLVKEMLR